MEKEEKNGHEGRASSVSSHKIYERVGDSRRWLYTGFVEYKHFEVKNMQQMELKGEA